MDQKKFRIQIIGRYLDSLKNDLNTRGIIVESIIHNGSPLSMAGKFDMAYKKYSDMPNMKDVSLLDIRKNLDQMLSHDPDKFCSNYNTQPAGVEVRQKNTSDYLVFMNSSAILTLYEKNDNVYSSMWPVSDFQKELMNDESCIKRSFPFSVAFNWKYYYDKFIDVLLNEYNGDHIIFIRTNCSRFYMDGNLIKPFDERSKQFRGMIEEMDEYFIEKTHCLVIDEHYSNIPPQYVKCAFPYIQMSKRLSLEIVNKISDVIINQNYNEYEPVVPVFSSEFAKFLNLHLSSEILDHNIDSLKFIDENRLSYRKITENYANKNEFFENIADLEKFMDCRKRYCLSDYALDIIAGKSNIDIELIYLYVRYFKLDLNDIIAVYTLCDMCENTSDFRKITKSILDNPDCIPVISAKTFKNKNISALRKYPYVDLRHIIDDTASSDTYIHLGNNCYIILNPDSSEPVRKVDIAISDKIDHMAIIENGYNCPVCCADALTYSFDYYVEKTRRGDGTKPSFLKFDSADDFNKSLNYIDYKELLENERFVFRIENSDRISIDNYKPVTDISDLFDRDVVTVRIYAGLGDQIGYYLMGQLIEKFTGRRVIYHDCCNAFNGLEVDKIAKNRLDLLNARLSRRLNRFEIKIENPYLENLYLKINKDCVHFISDMRFFMPNVSTLYTTNYENFIKLKMPYTYLFALVHTELLMRAFDFKVSDFIEFPAFNREEHRELAQKIQSCDSVVIHIRRGDYVTLNTSREKKVNYKYYAEAIEKILSIREYNCKKYFIFSDDILWCKEHKSEIGLDLVGDSEVIFVDCNKGEESYRDIQLMALGKIMIASHSGFANFAALYNENCELFIGPSIHVTALKKNKYDVEHNREPYFISISD